MKTWRIGLIYDVANAAKGAAALVFAPFVDTLLPPQDWSRTDAYRAAAEELAEREAEEEVAEPRPRQFCGNCGCFILGEIAAVNPNTPGAVYCSAKCADAAAEKLADREAEEEVVEPSAEPDSCPADCPKRGWHETPNGRYYTHHSVTLAGSPKGDGPVQFEVTDEARERIGEVHDFVPASFPKDPPSGPGYVLVSGDSGWEWAPPPEPALTDDELVAVRQLIEERFPLNSVDPQPLCPRGYPVAECHGPDCTDTPAVERTAAGATDGQAVHLPPQATACPSPNFVDWLEPAICTVLHTHFPELSSLSGRLDCSPGTEDCPMWDDEQAWLEHVSPLIAQRIELALRTTDFDFNQPLPEESK